MKTHVRSHGWETSSSSRRATFRTFRTVAKALCGRWVSPCSFESPPTCKGCKAKGLPPEVVAEIMERHGNNGCGGVE